MIAALAALAALAMPATQQAGPVVWSPCAVDAEDSSQTAECAVVSMPLRHDLDDSDNIGIAVKRVLGSSHPGRQGGTGTTPVAARRQVWFLNGGPGDSGIEAIGRVRPLFDDGGIDVYTLDHRGVGGSALLACPEQQAEDSEEGNEVAAAEWGSCIEFINAERHDLLALTITQAAHDVGRLIELTRGPEDRVFVFGASYGTTWANRYLSLYPEQPEGVILDGIVPADWTFAEFDSGLDTTARSILARCANFQECSRHLGADPIALAEALPGKFDAGHCSDLQIDSNTVRLLLGNMLMGGPEVWPYIPAMVYRLDRCKLRDLLAIGELFARLFESGEAGQESESHAQVLQRHIVLSELWPDPSPPVEDFEAAIEETLMTTAVSASFASTWAQWPRYPLDEHTGQFATFEGPMLMLHGGLDPTMPVERLRDLRARFGGEHQTFAFFPHAGHVTVNSGGSCAAGLYGAFVDNPAATLDLGCIADLPPVDFSGTRFDADSLFGTADFWGDRLSTLEWLLVAAAVAVLGALVGVVRWGVRRRRRRARPELDLEGSKAPGADQG